MYMTKAFRTSNTVRVTMPRAARHALNIQPRDILMLDHIAPGQLLLTNLSAEERARKRRKKTK